MVGLQDQFWSSWRPGFASWTGDLEAGEFAGSGGRAVEVVVHVVAIARDMAHKHIRPWITDAASGGNPDRVVGAISAGGGRAFWPRDDLGSIGTGQRGKAVGVGVGVGVAAEEPFDAIGHAAVVVVEVGGLAGNSIGGGPGTVAADGGGGAGIDREVTAGQSGRQIHGEGSRGCRVLIEAELVGCAEGRGKPARWHRRPWTSWPRC